MLKIIIMVVVALMSGIPGVCSAASSEPGAYVSGFLGVSVPRDTRASGTDSTTDFDDSVKFDPGIYLGGSGGYDFGMFRLEGELSYRYSEIDSITVQGLPQFRRIDGNLGVFAMMFNGFFDLHNESPVTPYLGGGVGFATLHLSDTFARGNAGTFFYGSGDDTVFAYQAGAGIDIALNKRLSMDLGYRYFATDNADFDSPETFTSMKFRSHNAVAGVRVKF